MLKISSITSLTNVISVTYCITISIIGNIFISNIHCSSKHNDGDIKLVDGPSELAGTVLVYRTYGWGKICDDHWTMKEANVVCKQLGMGYALEVYRRNRFGSSSQINYLMDEVQCTGSEKRLIDCRFNGWGVHDCRQNEEAGVKCAQKAPVIDKPPWNPLRLNFSRNELEKMSKVQFNVINQLSGSSQQSQSSTFLPVVIKTKNGTIGTVCPDHFHAAEAIVFCHQMNTGHGGRVIPMPIKQTGIEGATKPIAIIGYCYGNETKLKDCKSYIDFNGVPCQSQLVAAVECTENLPDLLPDRYSLETSAYIQKMSLWLLECALEENCLPEIVYRIIDNNPYNYTWMTRTLMRFSSIIENAGNEVFRPLEDPENWEWHACHMHYHSMKVFSRYEVVDTEKRLVAVGHKSSFCLEDNLCKSGIAPKFRCSNIVDSKGTQGISPGCKDMYLHDYDCQWVDITDIPPGQYIFQVSFNPDFLVPESNFFNNALTCQMTHLGYNAVLRHCQFIHINDLF
ncbi:unnamed protein product [Trichobilharzia szidati]|nr:unnamed protein product [Trichobilharzia szidati]